MSIRSIIPISAIILLIASCGKRQQTRQTQGMVWNTQYHITYSSPLQLDDSITAVLSRTGSSLSVFDTASLVSRVNRASNFETVDSAFRSVYLESVRINRISNGRFDPTLSPLITAWGFGKGHTPTADTARIDSIMRFVGIAKTHLKGDSLFKDHPLVQFNFSAIAKGYGCDEVGRMLQRNGVTDYLVEIGGEITAAGVSPSNKFWKIAVERPLFSDSQVNPSQAVIRLPAPCGIATSGNYRNYYKTSGGGIYGHTIDPVTGRPFISDMLSATVVARTCMEADALATACMAMTSADAKAMIDSLGYAAMFVTSDSTVWMSREFEDLVTE